MTIRDEHRDATAGPALPEGVPARAVAAHAVTDVPTAQAGQTAREVLTGLRGRRFDTVALVAVCRGDVLVGVVTMEGLLAAAPASPVVDLMDPAQPTVTPGTDQEHAAWQAVQHGESALAVVDEHRRFVGLVPPQRLLGVLIAFFVPGVVYLADAVGTQTVALVIRGLSVGVAIDRVARREAVTGVLLGLLFAALSYPLVLLLWGDAQVAAAVAVALFAASSVATVIAMLLPWVLHRLGRDPAFGSGPLATVVQDLLSIAIYFLAVYFLAAAVIV